MPASWLGEVQVVSVDPHEGYRSVVTRPDPVRQDVDFEANHVVLTRRLHAHLAWRNANARAPELLAGQRRERTRVRSEKHRRWERPATRAA